MTWGNVLARLGHMSVQPDAITVRAAELRQVALQAGDSATRVGSAPRSDLPGAMFSRALADACETFARSGVTLSYFAQTTAEDISTYVRTVSQQDSTAAQGMNAGVRQ